MEIVEKYKPIFYLHPDEEYFPSSFQYFVAHSKMIDNGRMVDPAPNSRTMYQYSKTFYHNELGRPELYLDLKDEGVVSGEEHSLNNVPLYVNVKKLSDKTVIQYIAFFPYQGSYRILGLEEIGAHYGDIEHISVECDNDGNMLRVYYSAHDEQSGCWLTPDKIETEQGRPVVYIAKRSHACYPHKGVYWRSWSLTNDFTAVGKRWDATAFLLRDEDDKEGFDIESMGAVYFAGVWGKRGICSLGNHGWFKGRDVEECKSPYMTSLTAFNVYKFSMISLGIIIMCSLFGIGVQLSTNNVMPAYAYFFALAVVLIIFVGLVKYLIRRIDSRMNRQLRHSI